MAERAQIPDWFYEHVSRGLAALVVLHLPGAPSHEVISMTEEVWIEALWSLNVAWDERLDAPRLSTGFLRLARQAERWPAPRALIELLPSRSQPVRLAGPSLSADERERSRKKLRELLNVLATSKKVRHG